MALRASLPTTLLLAAAGLSWTADAAVAQEPGALPREEIIVPAIPAGSLGDDWQAAFQSGTILLRPDATLRSYDNTTSVGTGFTALDPGATLTAPPYAAAPIGRSTPMPSGPNLTGLRAPLPGEYFWRGGISAVGGQDWSIEEDGSDVSYSLVARDDREAVVRDVRLPHSKNVLGAAALLATRLGLRAVLAVPAHYRPEGAGGRIVDRRGRSIAQLKAMSPTAAVALADGTIFVLGDTTYGRSFARVTPAGLVTYPRLIRPKAHQVRTPLQTASGLYVAMIKTAGSALRPGFARLSGRGVLGPKRAIDAMSIPWSSGCAGDGVERFLEQSLVGPSGTIVIVVSCWPKPSGVPGGSQLSTVVELSADLRSGRVLAAAPQGNFRKVGTLPDGRLYLAHTDGSVGAISLADALPVTRGTLGAVTPRGTDQAVVRVHCRAPYGSICNGRIEVRDASGSFFGWAPYALPGRPGRAEAEADVTVQRTSTPSTSSPVAPAATATLLTLPAQFERGSAAPPSS